MLQSISSSASFGQLSPPFFAGVITVTMVLLIITPWPQDTLQELGTEWTSASQSTLLVPSWHSRAPCLSCITVVRQSISSKQIYGEGKFKNITYQDMDNRCRIGFE